MMMDLHIHRQPGLIILLPLLLLTVSCVTDSENLLEDHELNGEWKWSHTDSGWFGRIDADSVDYSRSVFISLADRNLILYRDAEQDTSLQLNYGEVPNESGEKWYFGTQLFQVLELVGDGDTLKLRPQWGCMDCSTDFFVRKSD